MTHSPEGILLLDKPGLEAQRVMAGDLESRLPTSHDMVQLVRRTLGLRRVGHTGTLDPFASGLLVICVGRATRLAEYYQALPKTYIAKIRFGAETDTGDITGQFLPGKELADWDPLRIESVLPNFVGLQMQVPPAYSAKRIMGKRAYELARAGERVELKAHEVHVYDITILPPQASREMTLQITCGAGTYIRSLAQDIARKAGTQACLSELRRISLGALSVEDAWKPDELKSASKWVPYSTACLRAGTGLPWPQLECASELARKLGQGQEALLARPGFSLSVGDRALAVDPEGDFLGILGCIGTFPDQTVKIKAEKWLAPSN